HAVAAVARAGALGYQFLERQWPWKAFRPAQLAGKLWARSGASQTALGRAGGCYPFAIRRRNITKPPPRNANTKRMNEVDSGAEAGPRRHCYRGTDFAG